MNGSTPHSTSLAVPSTQNTAPILDFRCLYTHDLRRKCKRWQDGVLRFHTFNRRLMVYDVSRNFVGDAHWRETAEVTDGDELELERGGVIVQVGEATGKTEQDLSGIFEKRNKEREERSKGRAASASSPLGHGSPSMQGPVRKTPTTPLARVSGGAANALPYAPRGPHGRATLPGRSPFAERTPFADCLTVERPTKRRKSNEQTPDLRSPGPSTVVSPLRQSGPLRRSTVRASASEPIEIIEIYDTGPPRVHGPRGRTTLRRDRIGMNRKESSIVGRPTPLDRGEVLPMGSEVVRREDAEPLSEPVANPLRLASRRGRKKLLCQDMARKAPDQQAPHPSPRHRSPVGHVDELEARAGGLHQERRASTRKPACEDSALLGPEPMATEADSARADVLPHADKAGQVRARCGAPAKRRSIPTKSTEGQATADARSVAEKGSDARVRAMPLPATESRASTTGNQQTRRVDRATTRRIGHPARIDTAVTDDTPKAQDYEQRPLRPQLPLESAAVQPKAARDRDVLGPWSREAFDLFEWRPPLPASSPAPASVIVAAPERLHP